MDMERTSINDTLTNCVVSQETWFLSIVASCAVGLSGVVPLAIMPEVGLKQTCGSDGKLLRLLLSFAVGGLLGDVFLHLLPEVWNDLPSKGTTGHVLLGCYILAGFFTFIIVEMVFAVSQEGFQISGYLNLLANAIDNFSHGLAVAASFIVSTKMGMLTTAAILIHEIPHEVGDFAILLKSGFDRWAAAKAQMSTAFIGVMGAIAALSANSLEDIGHKTWWILPFTAGGFLNIALVNILPDLMKENDPRESFKQVLCIVLGIAVMGIVGLAVE